MNLVGDATDAFLVEPFAHVDEFPDVATDTSTIEVADPTYVDGSSQRSCCCVIDNVCRETARASSLLTARSPAIAGRNGSAFSTVVSGMCKSSGVSAPFERGD